MILGELFHQNKSSLVEFRFQSALPLVTWASLFNLCSYHSPLYVIYIIHIHILYITSLKCFITNLHLFFPYSTVPVLTWRNTFFFIPQLHSSINYIRVEWIVTARQPMNCHGTSTTKTYPIVILIVIIRISALIQFMLTQKT